MKIKPLGFYVIIEMEKVEEVSKGGIILNSSEVAKEQEATDIGYVRAIGPTAYDGYPGCDKIRVCGQGGDIKIEVPIPPAECWGLEIGQKVEYRRFEGKQTAHKDYPNHRYIPDSHIIGAIVE